MGGSDGDHIFHESGPVHLKDVNWSNRDHLKTVAASLVKGVYVLERDRLKKREGTDQALATPWWASFKFQKFKELINLKDKSVYGIIYELEPQHQKIEAPRFVIAFRGTLNKSEDMKSDLKIFHQCFHRGKLCESATEEVEKIVKMEQDTISTKVWLAGHSLGSAVAIHAGKKMAEKDVLLETFLFNPPFPALSSSTSTGKVANFLKGREQRSKDAESLEKVSKWLPKLYVDQDDLICSTYITYFKKRQEMLDKGAELKEIWETMNSLRAVVKNKIFGENADFYPFYLIPSAFLCIKKSNSSFRKKMKEAVDLYCWGTEKKEAHELRQWWRMDARIEEKEYRFS